MLLKIKKRSDVMAKFLALEISRKAIFRIVALILLIANIALTFYVLSYLDERIIELEIKIEQNLKVRQCMMTPGSNKI